MHRERARKSLCREKITAMKTILEICVDSVESAKNAEAGGADRIELCSALSVGGLTPSSGLMMMVRAAVKIPIYVMIRPRDGNFTYSDLEVEQMEQEIEDIRRLGADGLVFGALDQDYAVDASTCRRLIKRAQKLPVTFHRAFDLTCNAGEALRKVIDLGFSNVLTSGLAQSAYMGRYQIKELVSQASSRINIIAGCGINPHNLEAIIMDTQVKFVHASAREEVTPVLDKEIVTGAQVYKKASSTLVFSLRKVLDDKHYEL